MRPVSGQLLLYPVTSSFFVYCMKAFGRKIFWDYFKALLSSTELYFLTGYIIKVYFTSSSVQSVLKIIYDCLYLKLLMLMLC
jgi:hypothetical protein